MLIPRPIVSNACQFSWIYLLCNNGEVVTSRFHEISVAIFQSSWHLFPMELQRIMPIVLNYSQKEIHMAELGGFACTREVFKRVCIKYFVFN